MSKLKKKVHYFVARLLQGAAKLLKKCWMPLAILIILMAIFFSLFRALTPWAKEYKNDVEQHLSVLFGQPVTINDLETSWYWFEPVLKMDQVTVSDKQEHVLKLKKLLVGINLFSSLWHWEIKPGVLYVDDVNLVIHQAHDHWDIDGLSQTKSSMTLEPTTYDAVLGWLLSQEKIIIKNVSGSVYLKDGTLIPIKKLNFTALHSFGHYRLNGHALLDQEKPTELSVIADLESDSMKIEQMSGHAYLSLQHFLPVQWQSFFPKSNFHFKKGEGDIALWLDLDHGHLNNVQSKVRAKDIVWTREGQPKKQHIESIQANTAWKSIRGGWKLSADQVNVRIGGVSWPENALSLEFKRASNTYKAFIKNLLIESVLAMNIDWPEKMQSWIAMQPRGELHDTQIHLVNEDMDYLLTRFTHLGWQNHENIPEVQQISGVLYWQPTEGRLELDGENTMVKPKNLPPLTFGLLNAAFDWKALTNGTRISMDRFVLSHSDLVLSARGALDEPQGTTSGNLRLNAEFAAKDARYLLDYIPGQYLKPKFDQWLKQDIKRIASANGRIIVNGPINAFPFDDKSGEFTVTSHMSGVDLLINSDWPVNRNIDANVRVDKRQFDANILHAELNEVSVDRLSLVINDIGTGKETLLIHGALEAPADKIKAYLFASPLKTSLAKLKPLDMQDNLGLDLNLDIPLYPESDHVLARGNVIFDHNSAILHLPLHAVTIDNVAGALQFNEYGITTGEVEATLAGKPLLLRAQSIPDPKPYTEISVTGTATLDFLRKTFPFALFSYMQGDLKLQSLFTLHTSPDVVDHLHVESNLNDVSIDLPAPLGKALNNPAPLNVDIDFNLNNTVALNLNYANGLTGELLFDSNKTAYTLKRGAFNLGKGQAVLPKQDGVIVTGSLGTVDIQQWRDAFAKLPADNSNESVMDNINTIDLKFDRVDFLNQIFNALAVKINKKSHDDWVVKLTQKNLAGELHYQSKANVLSGHFSRLMLNKPDLRTKKTKQADVVLKPKDIPNLDITVDDFKIDDIDAGQLSLKSESTDSKWLLDYCNIKTPEYQLSIRGDWVQNPKKNTTTMQAGLQIEDLGKSLERWHLTPVVQARSGDLQFNGEWPGSFADFSLNSIVGKLNITLKNGRINHFDKDTENKLGLGKLLSILSLQTIPRRLKLDFSDLSEEGYSFDIFKGSFDVKHGVMTTDDSYIDGPVAYASMKGDLDFSKRLYDVDLRITPYIAASLPIVATIAGGPIAGVATWVASNMINKGMQKISGYTYKVSGPWSDPVVQQVKIYRR